jgi:hypothetical protein
VQGREGAAQCREEGQEDRTRVRVRCTSGAATGERRGHHEQQQHVHHDQHDPLDPRAEPPRPDRPRFDPARPRPELDQHAGQQRDNGPEGHRPVGDGDRTQAAAFDGDEETVDHRDPDDAPGESAQEPASGGHRREGQHERGDAEQQQLQPEAGDPEGSDEVLQRRLVRVWAAVEHERRPRQQRADQCQEAARDTQRSGVRAESRYEAGHSARRRPGGARGEGRARRAGGGGHARTLSDSPKKPCGRNTSTAMSTTKIQT